MVIQILRREQWVGLLLLSFGLTTAIASGFVPAARELTEILLRIFPWRFSSAVQEWIVGVFSFPALALFFHLSLPRRKTDSLPVPRLWQTLPLPILLAYLYGLSKPGTEVDLRSLVWYVVAVPLAEEFLFRGWLFGLIERFWPHHWGCLTTPLPVTVWATALAFSLWHLQNWGTEAWGVVAFQVLYTFFTGLWLGYLRWKSTKLRIGIGAHSLINLATILGSTDLLK